MANIKKFRILSFKSNKPILSTHLISKSIKKRLILRKINIHVNRGEIFGLLGPNGAGKSVTFNILLGIMKADKGDIFILGKKINNFAIHQRSSIFSIGYVPQADSVFRGLSCEDNLRAITQISNSDRKEQELTVQRLLEEFDLTHLSNIRADNLSGGERKRLTIARALVNNPKILLMDEPFGAVDPINIEMIKKIIVALQKKGVSVIITDHSATNVLSIVDRCSLISSGEIIISGKPKEIVNNLEARRIYFGDSFDL